MDEEHREITDFIAAWDAAMIGNDVATIGEFIADDWTIIGPDGHVGGKARFLAFIASGELMHDEMTSEDVQIRVYGDTAVTIARGVSGGRHNGQPFRLTERSSCVLVKRSGRWRCVSTHLSALPDAGSR